MKKLSLILYTLLSVCFIFTGTLSAQDGKFFVGIEGAYNAHVIANQQNYGQRELDYDGVTYKPAYGVKVGYNFNGRSVVSIGAGFIQGGQKYFDDDYGNGDELKRTVQLKYLSIPITYRQIFSNTDNIYHGTKMYVEAGAQINLLQSAAVTHIVNGNDVTLLEFATYDTGDGPFTNPHESVIKENVEADGEPEEDADLFEDTDIRGFIGLGVVIYLSENFSLDIGLQGGISVTDINDDDWRLKGLHAGALHEYEPSRNAFGGLNVGLKYLF